MIDYKLIPNLLLGATPPHSRINLHNIYYAGEVLRVSASFMNT